MPALLKLSLREAFAWLTVACLIAGIYYQQRVIADARRRSVEFANEVISIRAIAAHHGIDIPRNDAGRGRSLPSSSPCELMPHSAILP
jgi:hypothetical protein